MFNAPAWHTTQAQEENKAIISAKIEAQLNELCETASEEVVAIIKQYPASNYSLACIKTEMVNLWRKNKKTFLGMQYQAIASAVVNMYDFEVYFPTSEN